MTARERISSRFDRFRGNGGGIESWLTEATPDLVFERLAQIDDQPLSRSQLNQLLILSHEGGVSQGFFDYYWSHDPVFHRLCNYNVGALPGYNAADYTGPAANLISSQDKLEFGLQRLYIDALLYFGNVRQAYRELRGKTFKEIADLFAVSRFDPVSLQARGPTLPIEEIASDERYLIAEMACKTLDPAIPPGEKLVDLIREAKKKYFPKQRATFRQLVDAIVAEPASADRKLQLELSLDEELTVSVRGDADISRHMKKLADKFENCRQIGLENTRKYLSMINELDVYVATSMRERPQFITVANFCREVFNDPRLRKLNLRHFDPTLSAASGHEDKGLIECLMVKSAKALVYIAGSGDSWGKDAEAAMALSQGKPVIMYCDQQKKAQIFRDVHPLTRLIQFDTGVAVGAMVSTTPHEVVTLLEEVFTNQLSYELRKKRDGYFQLVESRTGCTVRVQTDDLLLRETFWNYYKSRSE
jgi:hypothetical protein